MNPSGKFRFPVAVISVLYAIIKIYMNINITLCDSITCIKLIIMIVVGRK